MAVRRFTVVSVVGARPQFVKAAQVSRALRACPGTSELIVHTGQHYDDGLSGVFFRELGIPAPSHQLAVGSGPHGAQTGEMLIRLERVLLTERPDVVVTYGDTNSTLAATLAAAKIGLPIAHVEAGVRSFNRLMPEEVNRVVADQLSHLLLCPSETAVKNLAREGVVRNVHLVGDVMADAVLQAVQTLSAGSDLHERLGVQPGKYLVLTLHRAENTRSLEDVRRVLSTLDRLGDRIVFPVHPRTGKMLGATSGPWPLPANLLRIDPLGYRDMIALIRSARLVLTDSGGIQKEAYWLGVPCVTLRDETEWVETVAAGWNVVVGTDAGRIADAVRTLAPPAARPVLYGDGHAAERCASLIVGVPSRDVPPCGPSPSGRASLPFGG